MEIIHCDHDIQQSRAISLHHELVDAHMTTWSIQTPLTGRRSFSERIAKVKRTMREDSANDAFDAYI